LAAVVTPVIQREADESDRAGGVVIASVAVLVATRTVVPLTWASDEQVAGDDRTRDPLPDCGCWEAPIPSRADERSSEALLQDFADIFDSGEDY